MSDHDAVTCDFGWLDVSTATRVDALGHSEEESVTDRDGDPAYGRQREKNRWNEQVIKLRTLTNMSGLQLHLCVHSCLVMVGSQRECADIFWNTDT